MNCKYQALSTSWIVGDICCKGMEAGLWHHLHLIGYWTKSCLSGVHCHKYWSLDGIDASDELFSSKDLALLFQVNKVQVVNSNNLNQSTVLNYKLACKLGNLAQPPVLQIPIQGHSSISSFKLKFMCCAFNNKI